MILLAEDGKLALDDDVRTYLPELPQLGPDPVTLRSCSTNPAPAGLRSA
jgi:CubicO group peptidase (beta-lactamase class C family)